MLFPKWLLTFSKIDAKERIDTMPRSPEAIKRAKAAYNKKINKVTIEFYPSDEELVKKLNSQPSKQAYIKKLIRQDI